VFVLILRIIEKLLIIYFSAYFIIDIALYIYSLSIFRKKTNIKTDDLSYHDHSISIIVPAFNEEVSIVSCIKMLLEIDYHDFEVIVVNDGSNDNTNGVMHEAFNLIKGEITEGQVGKGNFTPSLSQNRT